jgi:thiosulfate dehydrogenase
MTMNRGLLALSAGALLSAAIYLPLRLQAASEPSPGHVLPPAEAGGVVVGLCDGETSIEVPWLKPEQRMNEEQARAVSNALMVKWRERHPDAEWQMAQAQPNQPAAQQGQAGAPAQAGPVQGGVYERLTPREQKIADIETAKFVEEGKEIFHNPDKLGGTIGVSCDMCHPDAANTHPETYPKYQTQLQRVALLRDMINWCIENPVKGKPLSPDDPRLRALEAYIISQRNGTALAYGKH